MKPNSPLHHSITPPLRVWLLAALFLSSFILRPSSFAAESPLYIPFQGQVTNQAGTIVADGQYSVIFNLYDQAVGGQPVWSERHVKIGVSRGMINVFLGSISPLTSVDFSQTKYLGITVDTDNLATTADPEMVPRSLIMPAFHAKNAEKLQGFSEAAIMPPGTVLPYAGSTAPTGFLLCDGSAKSRTTYSRLFDVLGTTYGAPDGANFNLPDMRGRIPAGRDDMGGAAATRLTAAGSGINGQLLGASGGAQAHTLTAAQSGLPAHSHGVNDPGHSHAGPIAAGGSGFTAVAINNPITNGGYLNGTSATTGITIQNSVAQNASQAHSITQPTIVLNYIIKY